MVNHAGQMTHKPFDVVCGNESDRGRPDGPVNRQGGRVGPQAEVDDRQALKTFQCPVGRGDKTETSEVGVAGEELFFPVLEVFLGTPLGSHFNNVGNGVLKDVKSSRTTIG